MKFVYLFNEGKASMRNVLGGKGANLCEMTRLGLPVPFGFIVSTEACTSFFEKGLSEDITEQIEKALKAVEKKTGKYFGCKKNPLIMSVRSGARVSMPGMMDSVLNLGLNDEIVEEQASETDKNPKFIYDCYRRFIQMYSDVVMGIDSTLFEKQIEKVKKESNVLLDKDLTEKDLKKLVTAFKKIYKTKIGEDFPQDVKKLLINCVCAVFKSWNTPRAKTYRQLNGIPDDWGTAVNVQQMVFGNFNSKSGTGVIFSRNPSSGENIFYGEYLMDAQGEDVVAGIRTPQPISHLKKQNSTAYEELYSYAKMLEKHYKDMQDMEFSIEDGKLYILQTRNGKRTAKANVKIAVELVQESIISEQEALNQIDVSKLDDILHNVLDIKSDVKSIASGLPASPGGGSGKIALTAEKAIEFYKAKEKVVLVRLDTSPEDIEGMSVVQGIVTARGGMTSHAAVVARGMGKICIAGCGDVEFLDKNKVKIGKSIFSEGDVISINGNTGEIYEGELPTKPAVKSKELAKLLEWADKYAKMGVRVNADTPEDVRLAYEFGADGIGLCRTEHMFFEKERIFEMRKMILSESTEEREKSLAKIKPFQKNDFVAIFKEMKGKPVTIRLLDPPLHEFLPKKDEDIKALAEAMGKTVKEVKETVIRLQEFNPMMGHRGLRLAVTYPEIYKMQTQAIIEAGIKTNEKYHFNIVPEIMIPLTSDINEFIYVKKIVQETAEATIAIQGKKIDYKIGTMIETPRSALTAEKISQCADFFSFGTNDLTQFTYGFSRDDSAKFLKEYYNKHIFSTDVFAHIDTDGVGDLIELAIKKAKENNQNISLGVCGEHGGDVQSVDYFKTLGLNYVSCSPYRVPIIQIYLAQNKTC